LILVIDNCFATPYLQQPIKWERIWWHSATKRWSRRVLGGVTVGDPELIHKIYLFSRLTGPSLFHLMLGFYQKFRDLAIRLIDIVKMFESR
jgi:O-succinylhomoserine sulfhydrylase